LTFDSHLKTIEAMKSPLNVGHNTFQDVEPQVLVSFITSKNQ